MVADRRRYSSDAAVGTVWLALADDRSEVGERLGRPGGDHPTRTGRGRRAVLRLCHPGRNLGELPRCLHRWPGHADPRHPPQALADGARGRHLGCRHCDRGGSHLGLSPLLRGLPHPDLPVVTRLGGRRVAQLFRFWSGESSPRAAGLGDRHRRQPGLRQLPQPVLDRLPRRTLSESAADRCAARRGHLRHRQRRGCGGVIYWATEGDGMTVPVVLTIAGSDSGAGAGIQADLKTFAALGVYGVSVITAITAQNTIGVRAVQEIDASVIAAQLDALAEDFSIAALKTGMLSSVVIIETVAAGVRRHGLRPLVVDPVMIAKSGDRLLREDAVDALRRMLLPLADVVTPNIPEAEVLTGLRIRTLADRVAAARAIMQLGAQAVVIKGGHTEDDPIVDLLVDGQGVHEYPAPRIVTTSKHGTGCTFSAAITAALATGLDLPHAVAEARDYVSRALASAPGLGHGHGPLNHFPAIRVAHARH